MKCLVCEAHHIELIHVLLSFLMPATSIVNVSFHSYLSFLHMYFYCVWLHHRNLVFHKNTGHTRKERKKYETLSLTTAHITAVNDHLILLEMQVYAFKLILSTGNNCLTIAQHFESWIGGNTAKSCVYKSTANYFRSRKAVL